VIILAKIVARGTTVLVASGDAGSPGRTNEACFSQETDYGWSNMNPIFPGGSPWVLSVGGTYVVEDHGEFRYRSPVCTTDNVTCAMGIEERGTTFSETHWTSGAGFTHWDQTPKWQQEQVKNYLESGIELPDDKYFNKNGRAYPDVSAFGHNCIIQMNNLFQEGWINIDGTSCSSPIFAGIITSLNAYQKSRGKPILGFVNPLLYRMHREVPNTFNDIIYGNSTCTEYDCCGVEFGFIGSKGWDPVSGLGTPNVEEMIRWLSIH